MVLPILIRWLLGRKGKRVSEEELRRMEEEAKRGRLPVTFWNKESAEEWNENMLKMLGEKTKYRRVLAGDITRTYYMLPHIPHAWKILERVGAMKDVMGGLIINDEVMDHFIGLEPAHISWAYMMGARTPEEIRTLGWAIRYAEGAAKIDKSEHFPRMDKEYVEELARWIEQFKDASKNIKAGYELLQKFRQEGRPFGKAVFEGSSDILLLKDRVVIVEGDAEIRGTSVIVKDGDAFFLDFSDLEGMKIQIESIEPVFEAGEFRGFRICAFRFGD